jgi:hypothetical protein
MPFRVDFGNSLFRLPSAAALRARAVLQETEASMDAMPRDTAFRLALGETDLIVEVEGWRLSYRVDPEKSLLVVTGADPRAAKPRLG